MLRLALLALLLLVVLAVPSTASSQEFFECADFTPASVAEACDQAVPAECRGPDAPSDFDACLRDNGTTPEAVDAAIAAARRAAGIPSGGVDTGLGGLAPEDDGGGGGTLAALLGAAAALLLTAFTVGRVRARAPRA